MSPLMIILLILILVIGSTHQITVEKYRVEEGNKRFPRIVDQKSSLIESLNYVTIKAEKNEQDLSEMRNNQLRKDLQHILSSVVKKIIWQRKMKAAKKKDVEMNKKTLGKIVGRNKITTGEFPEDNNEVKRGLEMKRANANNTSVIGRKIGNEVRDKLKKDLIQISDALVPTIRRISDFKLQDALNYTKQTNAAIDRGNKRELVKNSRVKRQSSQDKANGTSEWLQNDLVDHVDNLKMHAFIVKDEEIPPCCTPAKPVSNRRYFMCSGAILSSNRAITSASCIHFADIHESNVNADLGVHVGGADSRSYVIKINHYEMHPDYDFDVDSKNYATNNLAVLYLGCSIIPEDVIIPRLPKGFNDDIAHVCCREACDLITLTITPDNHHVVHAIMAKHLPAPVHDDEDALAYRRLSESALESLREINKPTFNNGSFTLSRRVRSPSKLAAAPTFFGKDSPRHSSRLQNAERSAESSIVKKRKKTKSQQKTTWINQQQSKKLKKLLNFDNLLSRKMAGKSHMSIMRALEKEGVNVQEQLAAINWDEIEKTMSKKLVASNREKMEIFAKNVVAETIKRLENVLEDVDEDDPIHFGNRSRIFESLMPNKNRNETIENFVHVFTKVVSSLVPPNGGIVKSSFDDDIEEKDLTDPPPSYKECPPIGTPVFANKTLVGLLAYSCDDLQDWVKWKYVNIAKNLYWIHKQIENESGGIITCSGPERPTRINFHDDLISPEDSQQKHSETEIQGRKIEWRRREANAEVQRSISRGNLDHARNPQRGTYQRIPKDPWFARNSPLTPQVQRENERRKIFPDSRNQPQSPPRNEPILNLNACYVKSDGSTTCHSRSDFSIH